MLIYILSFIKGPSWVLDRLCNCMLSKGEGRKITEETRLTGRKGEQEKKQT